MLTGHQAQQKSYVLWLHPHKSDVQEKLLSSCEIIICSSIKKAVFPKADDTSREHSCLCQEVFSLLNKIQWEASGETVC